MNQHQQAFFIPFGLWTLLGVVLIARIFIVGIKGGKAHQAGNRSYLPDQAQEVQKQFNIVGLVLVLTLPIAFLAYYLLGG